MAVQLEAGSSSRPHAGKVFAAVFPHSDDFSLAVGGTILKLIHEGYTGYLIRTTNDEKDSCGMSIGETIAEIERETYAMAQTLGIKKVYDLNYKNHYLDAVPPTELRHRLISLFRHLQVDTIISFDPWGHYEENPDHYVTAAQVEAACWMAGRASDLPELEDMGVKPKSVQERYYWARGPQKVNRIVDTSPFFQKKREAVLCNKTPIRRMIRDKRNQLAREGKRIPELEGDEGAAFRFWIDKVLLPPDARLGAEYGFDFAEAFHYISETGES